MAYPFPGSTRQSGYFYELKYHEKWNGGPLASIYDAAVPQTVETQESGSPERSSREGSNFTDMSCGSCATDDSHAPSSRSGTGSAPSASQSHRYGSVHRTTSPQPASRLHRSRRDSVLSTTSNGFAHPPPPSHSSPSSSSTSLGPSSPFRCCGLSYVNRRTLRRHHREQRECPRWLGPQPRFRCFLCRKTFKRKFSVKQHISEVHGLPKAEAKEIMETWHTKENNNPRGRSGEMT